MNILEPWNVVFFVGFSVYVGTRHVFERRAKGEQRTLSRVDGLEKGLLAMVVLGSLLLPMLYLFSPFLAFADYRPAAIVPWCGLGFLLTALWLFWRSHADLGKNWSASLELRKGHELITRGVYRRIRHPMYAAIWLFGIAQALLLQNWLAGCAALVTFAPLYLLRTPREEEMMSEEFGDGYRQYTRATGRLIPRIFGGA